MMISGTRIWRLMVWMHGSPWLTDRSVHEAKSCVSKDSGAIARASPRYIQTRAFRTVVVSIATQERLRTSVRWSRTASMELKRVPRDLQTGCGDIKADSPRD